jgi:hypothetical protein
MGRTESNAPMQVSRAILVTLKRQFTKCFAVPWALICRGVRLGKRTGLCCIWFRRHDLLYRYTVGFTLQKICEFPWSIPADFYQHRRNSCLRMYLKNRYPRGYNFTHAGRDSVVGTGSREGLDSPGIESRCGWIFRTPPDRPYGSRSLLYDGYRVPFRGLSGRGVALTNRRYLAPRLMKEYSYTPTSNPSLDLHGLFKGQFCNFNNFCLPFIDLFESWNLNCVLRHDLCTLQEQLSLSTSSAVFRWLCRSQNIWHQIT